MGKTPYIVLVFARKLKALRIERELSQERLAEMAGLDRTYIGMLERAQKNITIAKLSRIAEALNVRPRILIEE